MRNYFKPWRRKMGAATLVVACAFMGMWLRSLRIAGVIVVPITEHKSMRLSSGSQAIELCFETIDSVNLTWDNVYWSFGTPIMEILDVNPDAWHGVQYGPRWVWKWHGFGVADRINIPDIPPSSQPVTLLAIPYWSIVLPPTLLSAYLLLMKPRSKLNQAVNHA